MVKVEDAHAESLQRNILSWDYWELLERSQAGSSLFKELTKVPSTFRNLQEYLDVYSPLVLEEAAAQLLSGNEDGQVLAPHAAMVATVEYSEEYVTARMTLPLGVNFEFARNDVILVSKDPLDESGADRLHAFGYVDGHEGERSLRVRFHITDASQKGNEAGLARVQRMRELLQPQSPWYIVKCANVSTVTREWVALQQVHRMPFNATLVTAQPVRALKKAYQVPPTMRHELAVQYNSSQLEAISAGLGGNAMVLIQGPPGTGKTRTILGLLSIIMHSAPRSVFQLGDAGGAPSATQLPAAQREALWRMASPWYCGELNPRDAVAPSELGRAEDAFGMAAPQQPHVVFKRLTHVKAHVLVCAPSNSALDEIVMRVLNNGLMDENGRAYQPSIVRVGVTNNIHHSVASVSLDQLLEARVGSASSGMPGGRGRQREAERMKQAILDEADIVCSTLSFAGSGIFTRMARPFDVVVIDEAAQAVEPATLVPLAIGAKQVYLVGDPIQLPATVISTLATEHGYSISMFKRLQGAGYPVQILDTQYRMHPAISEFPSREFYAGKLKNAPDMDKLTAQPWHEHRAFGPLAVFDVPGKEVIPESGASIENRVEAELVLLLYHELTRRYPQLRTSTSVAVISPYKAQVRLLRSKFKEALGEDGARMVDVNTIDGFQGREKDIAIFSTVRSSRRSIGFVSDERRINVGLTRARCSLLVVGNCKALQQDQRWHNLILHARNNRCLYKSRKPFSDFLEAVLDGSQGPLDPLIDDQYAEPVSMAPAAEEGAEDADCYSDYEEMPETVPSQQKKRKGAAANTSTGKPSGKTAVAPRKRPRK